MGADPTPIIPKFVGILKQALLLARDILIVSQKESLFEYAEHVLHLLCPPLQAVSTNTNKYDMISSVIVKSKNGLPWQSIL